MRHSSPKEIHVASFTASGALQALIRYVSRNERRFRQSALKIRLPFNRRQTSREHIGDNTPPFLKPADVQYQPR